MAVTYCVGLALYTFYFREFRRQSIKYGNAWWFVSGFGNFIGFVGITLAGLEALAWVLWVPILLSYRAMFPKRVNPTGNAV
jgi:hypothetical protein